MPMMVIAVTIFPLPDSPTMPREARGATSKVTSSIAVSHPCSPRNRTVSSRTDSSVPSATSGLDLQARIKHVAQPVAQQVHTECGKADGDPREQHDPPCLH